MEYFLKIKLNYARNLLETTNLSVVDIGKIFEEIKVVFIDIKNNADFWKEIEGKFLNLSNKTYWCRLACNLAVVPSHC